MATRGHVALNNKDYIITDGSYISQIVPLFRPQLSVEGISHEALDQYLYQVQESWDRGRNIHGQQLGVWKAGTYRSIDGLYNGDEGKLRLQYKTLTSDAFPSPPKKGRLVSFGGFLYQAREDGVVRRTSDGTTWTAVTYDNATNGNITAMRVGSMSAILCGTDTGFIFLTLAGAAFTPINAIDLGADPIKEVYSYRGHVAACYGNKLEVRSVNESGTIAASAKYTSVLPGQGVAAAIYQQALFIGMQAGETGTIIGAADLNQIVDTYPLFGSFLVESMTTWGSFLIYGGHRPSDTSEIYTFREVLSEKFAKGVAPVGVLALMPLSDFVLAAWNEKGGVWWIDNQGSGPFAQNSGGTDANRIVRSIAHFLGNVYYTLDGVGVIKVDSTQYVTSGTLDSGWFDAGFPELDKDQGDIFIRLDEALASGQSVSVSVRKEGESGFTSAGSVAAGATSGLLGVPTTHLRSKRLEVRLTLGSGGTNTPTVSAVILRYRPVPVDKWVWGFTVLINKALTFLDSSRETRKPSDIIADLKALRTAGKVKFKSAMEPTERDVYVSNVVIKNQLMGQDASKPLNEEEGYAAVEVLEA